MVLAMNYFQRVTRWVSLNKRTSFFSIVGILTSIAVLSSCIGFRLEGIGAGVYQDVFKTAKENKAHIDLRIDLISIDLAARRSEILVHFTPQDDLKTSNGAISSPVKLDFLYFQKYYRAGQKPEPFVVTVPFLRGAIRDYPFDRFFLAFPVEAEIAHSKSNNETRAGLVEAVLTSHVRSHSTISKHFDTTGDPNLKAYAKNSLAISVDLVRPRTTIMAAILVTFLMWGFSIVMLILTFEFMTSEERLSPILIGVGPSILFVLPSLRLIQPGVPDSGCLIDMAGFFWAMVLVSICSFLMIISWTISNPRLLSTSTSSTSSFLDCRWAPTPPKAEPHYPSLHNSCHRITTSTRLESQSTFQPVPSLNPFNLSTLNSSVHTSIPTYI